MKRELFKKGLLLSIMMMSISVGYAQRMWTLDECVQYAIDNNTNIEQRKILIEQGDIDLNISKNAILPIINAEVGEQISFGNYNATTGSLDGSEVSYNRDLRYTSANVQLSMPIFSGFKIKNQIQSNQFQLQAATADLESAKNDIRIQVAIYYLQCLYYKSMEIVAKEQVEVSSELVVRAKHLVDDGKRPFSELANAESILASDEYDLTNASGQAQLSLLTLSQLLNLPESDDFDIEDIGQEELAPFTQSASDIYNQVAEIYPSIQAEKFRIQQKEAALLVERSGLYPSLSLQAGVSSFYVDMFHYDLGWGGFGKQFGNNMNEVVGLNLSIPIFNGFDARNKIKKARLSISSNEALLKDAYLTLNKDIQTAYTNAVVAQNKYYSAKKSDQAATISLGYEIDKYESGYSTIFDFQDAQQKSLSAKQNLLQAQFEYMIRKRVLEFYQQYE